MRFEVQDVDVFGDPNFVGQATYPVSLLVVILNYHKKIYCEEKCPVFDFNTKQEKSNEPVFFFLFTVVTRYFQVFE